MMRITVGCYDNHSLFFSCSISFLMSETVNATSNKLHQADQPNKRKVYSLGQWNTKAANQTKANEEPKPIK